MKLPNIAVTIGDPSGIGPEIISKMLAVEPVDYARLLIIGDKNLFPSADDSPDVEFIHLPFPSGEKVTPGRFTAMTGRHSYEAIVRALELIESGAADALVTAPVSKAAMHLAGIKYPGQTELLADMTGTRNYAMLMSCGNILSGMVTRHIPIAEIPKTLSTDKIIDLAKTVKNFCRSAYGKENPKLCVCALNPHAGESGLLGSEEKNIITPAVNALKEAGFDVTGPLPCDSAWVKMKDGKFDALVTMYHDQTMIGLKCISPEKIVNITAGLPFIRTSPGHGTAYDIAGKNLADCRSMREAVKTAAKLAFNLKNR